MCYFLCVALSPKGSVDKAIEAMAAHDLDLRTISENINAHHFEPGTHFMVCKGHCECGHPLGSGLSDHRRWPEPKADPRWSEARRARWQKDVDSHSREADNKQKANATLTRWRLALCEALLAGKGDWIGVYGANYEFYVTSEPLGLTFHRVRQPEELTLELMHDLPHCTVLQIGRFQAEHYAEASA